MNQEKWHTDGCPNKAGHYLVTSLLNWYSGGNMDENENGSPRSLKVAYYVPTCGWNVPLVVAWQDLPDVYLGEDTSLLDLEDAEVIL